MKAIYIFQQIRDLLSLKKETRPLGILSLVLLSLSSGCFDYYEKVELKEDFSGSLQIIYTVPVSEESLSRLSFLAAKEEDIREHYREAKIKSDFQLRDIEITPIKAKAEKKHLKSKKQSKKREKKNSLRVSYRIDFSNPKILEYTPLRNTKILESKERLQIQRSFPALQSQTKIKGPILKRIAKHLRKHFSKRTISYTTILPENYKISTNKGTMDKDKTHTYKLSLLKTIEASKDIFWSLNLKK